MPHSTHSAPAPIARAVRDYAITTLLLVLLLTSRQGVHADEGNSNTNESWADWPALTPWATQGTLATSSVPWVVYSTVVATNATNSMFPSVCYDAPRERILASYIDSNSHECTNGTVHLVSSYDGGRTWVDDRELNLFPGHGCVHATLTALRDGSLLLSAVARDYRRQNVPYSFANSILSPIHVFQSLDGGLTWKTNSVISPATNLFLASNSIHETEEGSWLLGVYNSETISSAWMARSTNQGGSWNLVPVEGPLNELSTVQRHPDGALFVLGRMLNWSPQVFSSTNDGESWECVGPVGINILQSSLGAITWYSSYPAFAFVGNRMVVMARMNPWGSAGMWWSDIYPYTNGFTFRGRNGYPSLYDAPVKLSESVVLWLSAFDNSINFLTSKKTNSWLEAWVIANDSEGWIPERGRPGSSTPAVALYRKDLPSSGRVTFWLNRGSISGAPVNDSAHGAIAMSSDLNEKILWCGSRTNVHFSESNTLASLWQTNEATIIWRAGRTNALDGSLVLDNCYLDYRHHGFSLRQSGSTVRFVQCNGQDTNYASSYMGILDGDTSGTPHVYAVRIRGERMFCYADGNLTANMISTNSNGSKHYSDSPDSSQHLSIGTFGEGTTGQPLMISDLVVFTNAISDAEIRHWMLRLKRGWTDEDLPAPEEPERWLLVWSCPDSTATYQVRSSFDLTVPWQNWEVVTNLPAQTTAMEFEAAGDQAFMTVLAIGTAEMGTQGTDAPVLTPLPSRIQPKHSPAVTSE